MNGTTNFMLSKMESEGADYGAVLKEAQDLGFAEGTSFASCVSNAVLVLTSLLTCRLFIRCIH